MFKFYKIYFDLEEHYRKDGMRNVIRFTLV